MVSIEEVETMKDAYSLMYIIENSLRLFIMDKMQKTYGLDWYRLAPRIEKIRPYVKDFNNLYFHELIPFLSVYPCFLDINSEQLAINLRILIPIRNKIAHHNYLSEEELFTLQDYYKYVIKILSGDNQIFINY